MPFFSSRPSLFPLYVVLAALTDPLAATEAGKTRTLKDIEFAVVDGHSLKLDLYLPSQPERPLVVWIHGGGWRNGSKERCHVNWLTEHGFTVASISYRLTDKAIFPAQIHDCKGAVRWLRAHAKEYRYSVDRIAVGGSSAGGHLAALLGTSGDIAALEGEVGGHLDHSSRVDAVVDYFGPTDFVLRSKSHPSRTNVEGSSVFLLLGGAADKNIDVARIASPVTYVTRDDPPFLVLHGDRDRTVFLEQSQRIQEEYDKLDLPLTLYVLEGAAHGGAAFYRGPQQERVVEFLNQHLLPSAQ